MMLMLLIAVLLGAAHDADGMEVEKLILVLASGVAPDCSLTLVIHGVCNDGEADGQTADRHASFRPSPHATQMQTPPLPPCRSPPRAGTSWGLASRRPRKPNLGRHNPNMAQVLL